MPRAALDGRRRRVLTCETMAAESSGVEETDAFERNHHTARPGAGGGAAAGLAATVPAEVRSQAAARGEPLRVGVMTDLSGPFAGAGSQPLWWGAEVDDRDVQRARRRGRPPGAGGDGRQPEPHGDRHQRGGTSARAGAGGGGDRHLFLRPRGAAGAALRAGAEDHVDHQRHLRSRCSRTRTSATCSARRSTPTSTAKAPSR